LKKAILLFLFITNHLYSQISGCTDPLSLNYNPSATQNDGSCSYAKTKIKPNHSIILNESLIETSGLIHFNKLLWTHNDDSDNHLYSLDTNGVIQNKIPLKNVSNTEWEEISQDQDYIYIGDFGNNNTGNRTDLHILRIEKKSLLSGIQKIDTIAFSYETQTDFTKTFANSTNFDCEAFIVTKDSIFLFSKQWKNSETSVYALAKTPGNHIAILKDTYNVDGLITCATYLEEKNLIVLGGYSHFLKPFIFLLYDFKDSDFFSGNKRKIDLRLPFHQIEGISTQDGLHYYLTNENFSKRPFLNIPQKIHYLDLSTFLSSNISK
jgi:hypothetical protein